MAGPVLRHYVNFEKLFPVMPTEKYSSSRYMISFLNVVFGKFSHEMAATLSNPQWIDTGIEQSLLCHLMVAHGYLLFQALYPRGWF